MKNRTYNSSKAKLEMKISKKFKRFKNEPLMDQVTDLVDLRSGQMVLRHISTALADSSELMEDYLDLMFDLDDVTRYCIARSINDAIRIRERKSGKVEKYYEVGKYRVYGMDTEYLIKVENTKVNETLEIV